MKLFVIIWVWAWCMSLPVRGAWIEMLEARVAALEGGVAPRAGSVD